MRPPFRSISTPCPAPLPANPTRRFPKPPFTVKRFLFYGDSTVKNSWELLMFMARRMCKVEWKPRQLHELFDPAVCPPVSDLKMVDPELSTVLNR